MDCRDELNYFMVILLAALTVIGGDWCSLDTGYSTITDGRGYPHSVYISAKRDGSIWLRVGQDHKDWLYQNEAKQRFLVTLLEQNEVDMLEYLDYTDECVLTDLKFAMHAYAAWHPSFLLAYDPATRLPVTIVFRMNPGERQRCRTNTTLSLTPDGQGLSCTGGRVNSCGYRDIMDKGQRSKTLIMKKLQLYPDGSPDSWKCPRVPSSSSYTFVGSYYHAYLKLASCEPPKDSRELGHEAKLRRFPDNGSNMAVIPDPQQTALADGDVTGWQVFAKIISINRNVFLQIWRPQVGKYHSFSLVGQSYFQPQELRFQQIILHPRDYIQIKKGDVLGFYFPEQSPLAWSLVPCAFPSQRTLVLHEPPALHIGSNVYFRDYFKSESDDGRFACRHYSVTAILGNKTTAKRIEDWICPTAAPPDGSQSWSSVEVHGVSHGSTNSRGNVIMRGGTGLTVKPDYDSSASSDRSIPLYLILLMIGGVLLLFLIIGLVSYNRAIQR